MTWEDILKACREKDKAALAKIGAPYPPVEPQPLNDDELIQQLASLGSKDHDHFKRVTREMHQRWKNANTSKTRGPNSRQANRRGIQQPDKES